MRPIDADELKKAIELLCEDERTNMTAIAYFALRELVDTMPTIEAEPVNGWISVKDKLPEPYENVLVFGNFNGIATYRVDYLDDYGRWFRTFYVTHWRTLPEPPKGE